MAKLSSLLRRTRPAPGVPGPPDFVGVGAQRCGTTWWFELISAHPAVSPPRVKEQHFFDTFCTKPMTEADVADYHDAFPREPGQIAGEWTPRYAHDFWTPPLLRRAAPDARLLFLMRDPVARLRSGIEHQSQLTPPRDPSQLAQIAADAAARGRYAFQLGRLFESFRREQVLVLQYEQCVADPAAQLVRTYRHLGIDDGFVPEGLEARTTQTAAGERLALPAAVRESYIRDAAPDVTQLTLLVPDFDPALWPDFPR